MPISSFSKSLQGLLLVGAVTSTGVARAQSLDVNVTLNPELRQALAGQLELTEQALEEGIRQSFAAVYSVADVAEFLRLSANAQSFSNKGLGVDYASKPDGFLFGFAANLTANAGNADLDNFAETVAGNIDRAVPVAGGAQLSVMAGYNFAKAGLPRLTAYVNGLAYPLGFSQLDGFFWNVGAHLQLRLLGPLGKQEILEWGGFLVTSGVQLSRMTLSLSETFEANTNLAPNVPIMTRSTGTMELYQAATTIPLELTTSLQLLYFVSIYGGIAVDFQFGDAGMTFDIDSDLETNDPLGGGTVALGTGTIDVNQVGGANQALVRGVLGVQANLGPVKVFGQLNVAAADLTVGLAAGLRIVL